VIAGKLWWLIRTALMRQAFLGYSDLDHARLRRRRAPVPGFIVRILMCEIDSLNTSMDRDRRELVELWVRIARAERAGINVLCYCPVDVPDHSSESCFRGAL